MDFPIPSATVEMRLTVSGFRRIPERLAFAIDGVLDGMLATRDKLDQGLFIARPGPMGELKPFRISDLVKVSTPPRTKALVIDVNEPIGNEYWERYLDSVKTLNVYSLDKRFPCLCCFYLTLSEQPPGSYEICDLCGWEDDPVQFRDPTYRGGANGDLSLNEARKQFELLKLSAKQEHFQLPSYPEYFSKQ